MKKLWTVLVVLALIGLGLAACAPSKPPAAPQETSPAKEPTATAPKAAEETMAAPATPTKPAAPEPTATPVKATIPEPTATPSKPAAPEPTATPTEEVLSLESRDTSLDKLQSYRMRWEAQWTSTEGDKTTEGTWHWTEEYSSNPPALHWNWTFTDLNTNEQNTMEAWQVGDTMYFILGEGQGCMSYSREEGESLTKGLFSPNSLGSLSEAKYVGMDTVNGIKAKHYTYDEKATGLAGFSKVAGEIWVAVDGGYVVKDIVRWEGGAGLFGASTTAQGKGQWAWELSDVNQPIKIQPPENCGGAAGELPIMPDATQKSTFGDMVTYQSASKLDDVVNFYKKEMVAAGWKMEGEPTSMAQMTMLTFVKGTQKAQVTITSDEGKTTVMISVTKE